MVEDDGLAIMPVVNSDLHATCKQKQKNFGTSQTKLTASTDLVQSDLPVKKFVLQLM